MADTCTAALTLPGGAVLVCQRPAGHPDPVTAYRHAFTDPARQVAIRWQESGTTIDPGGQPCPP